MARIEPGDIVMYKLGTSIVNGEYVEMFDDDYGTVLGVSENDIVVLWNSRIEHYTPGDLIVVPRQ